MKLMKIKSWYEYNHVVELFKGRKSKNFLPLDLVVHLFHVSLVLPKVPVSAKNKMPYWSLVKVMNET